MEAPTRYAKSGDVHIAYRVFGDGPRDIVLIPGTLSHVELLWEVPVNEHLLKRLTAFARVIVFDKRGQGLSDRVADQTIGFPRAAPRASRTVQGATALPFRRVQGAAAHDPRRVRGARAPGSRASTRS